MNGGQTFPSRGDLYLLTTVAIWGNVFPVAKYVLGTLPPLTFAASRYFLAAIVLMLLLVWREGLQLPRRRDLPALIAFGFFGVTVLQLLWTNALALTAASKGAILVALSPIFGMLITALRGQRPTPLAWAGVVLSFAGVFLVINNSLTRFNLAGGSLVGDLLFLGVALCWAGYSVMAPPYLQRLGPLRVTAWSMLFGAVLLLPFMAIDLHRVDWNAVSWPIWIGFLYTAIPAGALGYLWWYEGISRLGVARSVIYSYLIPVFAVLSAVLFLGEHVSGYQLAGAAVVIAGLALTRFGAGRQ